VIMLIKVTLGSALYLFNRPLGKLGVLLVAPVSGYPELELLIVMVLCPCLMNIVQFWVFDSVLKKKLRAAGVEPLNLQLASEEEEERRFTSVSPQKPYATIPPRPIELSDPSLTTVRYAPTGGYDEQIIGKTWKKEAEYDAADDEERRNESFQQEKGVKDDRLLSHQIISDGLHLTDAFDDDGDLNDSVDLFLEEDEEHISSSISTHHDSLSTVSLSPGLGAHQTYHSIANLSQEQ